MTAHLVAKKEDTGGELWVGDWYDAQKFNGECLCVLENVGAGYPGMTYNIHIKDLWNHVNTDKINEAADVIDKCLNDGKTLLVHCAAGIERSPLTCAWWLRRTGVHSTLEAAYTHLMIIRPCVQNRMVWLDAEVR
jgi:hypothetical protein